MGQGRRRSAVRAILLVLLSAIGLLAQPSSALPQAMLPAPILKPGEGLAIAFDTEVRTYGAARAEAPIGGLAKLLWLRLEGSEWAAQGVIFRCTGSSSCGLPKGHGRLSLGRALQVDCNPAFLAWIAESRSRWEKDYGEAIARIRLEEVFAPFLGRRLPPGEGLPAFTASWVGDGDLLRASPLTLLSWLLEPDKPEVISFGKRHLAGFWMEVKELFGKEDWWCKTATAMVPGDPSATSAWAVGGRGPVVLVFHMPRGKGQPEAQARFREILGLKL